MSNLFYLRYSLKWDPIFSIIAMTIEANPRAPSHKTSFAQKCLPQFEQVVCLRTDNGLWLRKPGIACRVVSAQIFVNQSESVPGDS